MDAPDSVELQLTPNEASDLAAIPAAVVPDGYDAAYVTVLDEGVAERSIAVLAHSDGDDVHEGWKAIKLKLTPSGNEDRTEDAEAAAFRDDVLYVAGSHYGSKDGPLEPKRSWMARMAAGDLADALDGDRAPLELARNVFALHRAVNDALAASGVDVLPLGDAAKEALIDATVKRGEKKDKRWNGRVRPDDQPINVEGMTFAPDGSLLVGLRVPVSASGNPLVVALTDLDALFDDRGDVPECATVWEIACGGTAEKPVGVRGMHTGADGSIHVLVGSLDAEGKDSVLLEDHPGAGEAHNVHWRVAGPLPEEGGAVEAEAVHEFPDLKSVEGLAQTPDGHFVYVVDRDDDVHLRFLMTD